MVPSGSVGNLLQGFAFGSQSEELRETSLHVLPWGDHMLRSLVCLGMVLLSIWSLGVHADVTPHISRAGVGCPDETCLWVSGDGFGDRPAVHLRSQGRSWVVPNEQIGHTRNPYTDDEISFKVPLSDQLIALDQSGIEILIMNNQTKVLSNPLRVFRTQPKFAFPLAGPTVPFEAGGSNYTITRLGDTPGTFQGIETLVGTFHQDPDRFRSVLQAMYSAGQRKLSLVLWYTEATLPNCRAELLLQIKNGSFCPQYITNVQQIVSYVQQLGFNEVVVRFAALGTNPATWSTLDQRLIGIVSGAIQIVRSAIQTVTRPSNDFQVYYDLCPECGGRPEGQTTQFALALYHDYLIRYGPSDTFGASIAYYPGRIQQYVEAVRAAGLPLPPQIALDVYATEGAEAELLRVQQELQRLGLAERPVTILESHYNNGLFSQAVFKARNYFALNARTVYQWQLDGQRGFHFDIQEPMEFESYKVPLAPIHILRTATVPAPFPGGQSVNTVTMTPRDQYAAVEFYTGDGLQEYVASVPCLSYPDTHPKQSTCHFEPPGDPRLMGPIKLRVVSMKGGRSGLADWSRPK